MFSGIVQMIVAAIASFLGGVMLLRFWMTASRVLPPYQIGKFIATFSNWIVIPLQKILPRNPRWDWASLIAALIIALIASIFKCLAILTIFIPKIVILLTILCLFNWVVYGIMGLLIIEVIFSWVNPHAPLASIVNALNRPYLQPLRKLIPPIGGIDLSVFVAFLILNILSRYFPVFLFRLG